LTRATRPILERFLEDFSRLDNLKEEEQRAFIEAIAKTFDKKLVEVIQPVRVALSGREVTPGIFEVIEILGREKVEKRITKAIASIT
jgi:glutamyl-tRNA synthetase